MIITVHKNNSIINPETQFSLYLNKVRIYHNKINLNNNLKLRISRKFGLMNLKI